MKSDEIIYKSTLRRIYKCFKREPFKVFVRKDFGHPNILRYLETLKELELIDEVRVLWKCGQRYSCVRGDAKGYKFKR